MIFPQLPHSSRVEEIHASFSSAGSPVSSARSLLTGSSSQYTQRRHRRGRSSRLSSVMLTRRRDTAGTPSRESPLHPASPWRADTPPRRGGLGDEFLYTGGPFRIPDNRPVPSGIVSDKGERGVSHGSRPPPACSAGPSGTTRTTPGDPEGPRNRRRQSMEHRSRTDAHVDRYAARAQGMVASEIRALFAVASRPEVVSLAGGMPYVSALPLDLVGDMVGDLLTRRGGEMLQYASAQGDPLLRERICEVMALEGIRAAADDVVVTVGAQQALDLLTRIFVDPGDVVLAEAPSYVGALGTFAAYQANVVHVPLDDYGLIPEALRETLERLRRERRRVKFLYTVPTFQNPAGVT